MQLFFKNHDQRTGVPMGRALESSLWQALEIFDDLPENDDSFLGLINSKKEVLKMMKYNKFVWLVEIPQPHKGGSYQGYYPRQRCREIMKDVFDNVEFKDIPGLKFEKYL
ncbi:hypothetical protein GO491_06675 [Flavobacteriaceae bacterium Ap0902]|nr:hypothetical protein [Flavobacteriaceae bacterium Ap0902]